MPFVDESALDDIPSDINVIPLIDVLLVLLLFFMASASFIATGGLDVKLPSANSQFQAARDESLIVSVDKEGRIEFAGKPVAVEALAGIFKSQAEGGKSKTVIVKGDENAHHGVIVSVLDAAAQAGLTDIAIAASSDKGVTAK